MHIDCKIVYIITLESYITIVASFIRLTTDDPFLDDIVGGCTTHPYLAQLLLWVDKANLGLFSVLF